MEVLLVVKLFCLRVWERLCFHLFSYSVNLHKNLLLLHFIIAGPCSSWRLVLMALSDRPLRLVGLVRRPTWDSGRGLMCFCFVLQLLGYCLDWICWHLLLEARRSVSRGSKLAGQELQRFFSSCWDQPLSSSFESSPLHAPFLYDTILQAVFSIQGNWEFHFHPHPAAPLLWLWYSWQYPQMHGLSLVWEYVLGPDNTSCLFALWAPCCRNRLGRKAPPYR